MKTSDFFFLSKEVKFLNLFLVHEIGLERELFNMFRLQTFAE